MDLMRPPPGVRAGKAVFSVTSSVAGYLPPASRPNSDQIRQILAEIGQTVVPTQLPPLHSTAGVDGIGGKSDVRTFLFWANGWFLGETGVEPNGNYPLMSW